MTAEALQVCDRASEALAQVPTLTEAMGCLDCERMFRTGAQCPYCTSQALLNIADTISQRSSVKRLDNARKGINEEEE